MITKELYEEANRLATLRRIEKHEVLRMQQIINTFHPTYSVCTKCSAQIRHGQRILLNWLNQQEIIEDVLLTIEPNPEPQLIKEANFDGGVDEVEAEKIGCQKCGGRNKKKTTEITTTKTTRKPRIKK